MVGQPRRASMRRYSDRYVVKKCIQPTALRDRGLTRERTYNQVKCKTFLTHMDELGSSMQDPKKKRKTLHLPHPIPIRTLERLACPLHCSSQIYQSIIPSSSEPSSPAGAPLPPQPSLSSPRLSQQLPLSLSLSASHHPRRRPPFPSSSPQSCQSTYSTPRSPSYFPLQWVVPHPFLRE